MLIGWQTSLVAGSAGLAIAAGTLALHYHDQALTFEADSTRRAAELSDLIIQHAQTERALEARTIQLTAIAAQRAAAGARIESTYDQSPGANAWGNSPIDADIARRLRDAGVAVPGNLRSAPDPAPNAPARGADQQRPSGVGAGSGAVGVQR